MQNKQKTEHSTKEKFKVYLEFLAPYKWYALALLVVIFLIQAMTILEKFYFKVIVDRGTDFLSALLPASKFIQILIALAVAYTLTLAIGTLARWLQLHLINNMDASMLTDVKRRYFNHILRLSHNFHTSHKTGSLITRLLRGASSLERMNDLFMFNVVPFVFQLLIVGISLYYFDTSSAFTILIISIMFIAFTAVVSGKQRKVNIEENELMDVESGKVSDFFTNVESIKYFGKEEQIHQTYHGVTQDTKDKHIESWGYFRLLDAGQHFILSIGTLTLFYLTLSNFIAGTTTLGTLVFVYTTYMSLIGPLFSFAQAIRNYNGAMADFEAIFEYGIIEQEVKDTPHAKKAKITEGEIRFDNVTFSYKKRKVLEHFSLNIPKHKKVALVGPSGSGKSTLIKLLYRLYDVQDGTICVDGKNITELQQESLRGELSIVPQECVLFDDTIYNNIKFANPKATRAQVMKAMRFAQLDKIVKHFPNKEHTIVGERGVKLSGGEKQRVSIARALLADKQILVLDEATSALDSETEHEIQKDLEKLMKGRTSIIIAHRLSTIMSADIIVVMDKGKIVQMGTHEQLIRRRGLYKRLWGLQKGGYIA